MKNVEADLELYATSLPVLGHLGNAIGRPMPVGSPGLGHRLEELCRGWCFDDLASGVCNRSPDDFDGLSGARGSVKTATNGTWFSDLHLVTFKSLISSIRVAHFFTK